MIPTLDWSNEQIAMAKKVSGYFERAKLSQELLGGTYRLNIQAAVELGEKAGFGKTEKEVRIKVAAISGERV